MKAIDGKLRVDQRYKYLSCFYAGKYQIESGMPSGQCENCGKMITNIATVIGEIDQRQYDIGLDCAVTLTGIEPMAIIQAQKEIRRESKLMKFFALECKAAYIGEHRIWLHDRNAGNKISGCKWIIPNTEKWQKVLSSYPGIVKTFDI